MPFLDFNLKFSFRHPFKWLFLKLLSLAYSTLINAWLLPYQLKLRSSAKSNLPVISVGNITMGGTGKTPMIDWLLKFCARNEVTAAVLTRGYRAKREATIQILNKETSRNSSYQSHGDEPWLLHKRNPDTDILVAANRVEAAKKVNSGVQLLLLDDGMQHLKLNRDLNIILVDSTVGFGNQSIFPLGPLREPIKSLSRADAVIFTRSNLKENAEVKSVVAKHVIPGTPFFSSKFLAEELVSSDGYQRVKIKDLKSKKCLLFSGIGNPDSFSTVLSKSGATVLKHLALADHQSYTPETLKQITELAESLDHDYLVCTEKDWVKLESAEAELPEFWYLKMEVKLDDSFEGFMQDYLAKNISK